MVFLTAGMGGGTGTGASPVIARIAKDLGILTVGVVTKPFEMEGKRKINRADEGILELQKYVDNLIVIPNQNIFHLAKPETSFTDALQFADNVLIDGVKSMIDVMVNTGIMNHDFADVKAVMSETGKVHLGTGIAEGENRVTEATEAAISNPLLENNSMKGAKGVLINITCGADTSLHDIDLANNLVREEADEDANIIWGVQKDKNLDGKFKISVVSTGIDNENYYRNLIQNEKNSNIERIHTLTNEETQLKTTVNESYEREQQSFFVDLQESSVKREQKKDVNKELRVLKKEKKKSLIAKIFGLKEKEEFESPKIQEINGNDGSHNEFKNEIKEIIEEKADSEIDTSELKIKENDSNLSELASKINHSLEDEKIKDLETKKSQNEIDDDLLQIPAFLRRQAN